jgi:SPP1 gp7 family putative phage head morphogenesis protein
MQENKQEYYSPIEKRMLQFFYSQFYAPLIQAIDKKDVRLNSVSYSYLISAIRDGSIQYKDGVFTGKYSAKISRELSQFATYDRRSNTWHGRPSPDVLVAAIYADGKRKEIISRMNTALDLCAQNIEQNIKTLSLGDNLPMSIMQGDIRQDLYKIGVMPEISAGVEKKLRQEYTENQQINIKNWQDEQIQRLRDMVQNYQTTGTDGSLQQMIQEEFNISANKAHFLARQETGLFFSKLSMNRASESGVRRYKWSTSHDEKVRESHKILNGKIIDFDNPPVVDQRTGRRAHAGEDYNCRCQKIWILD